MAALDAAIGHLGHSTSFAGHEAGLRSKSLCDLHALALSGDSHAFLRRLVLEMIRNLAAQRQDAMPRKADNVTAQASNAQREPSMEEILASIRRIIEDSDTAKNEDPIVGMGFGEEGSQATPAEDWNEAGATFGEETYSHGESPSAGENDDAPPRSMMEIQAGTPRRESSGAEIHPHPAIGRTSELEEYPREEGLDEPQSHEQAVPFAPVFREDTGEDDQAEPTEPQFDLMSETEMFAALQGMADAEKAMDRPSEADPLNEPSSIISDQAGRQVSAAFGELSNAMEVNRRRQMDRMARDMLRPMLQEWLDNNLPSLVEKLVREEIQRVARGG